MLLVWGVFYFVAILIFICWLICFVFSQFFMSFFLGGQNLMGSIALFDCPMCIVSVVIAHINKINASLPFILYRCTVTICVNFDEVSSKLL